MSADFGAVWPAPAKLNLFLHVVGRREDGYHLLQTVFQFLDHGDDIQFAIREDGKIHRYGAVGDVPEQADLMVRAARRLQAETGSHLGADIRITKRLPMGGGLGGGSSDAATVLVALNHLWRLRLDVERLAAIGLELGADVPVFIRGVAAWAEGVGENLTPVAPPEPWYLVVKPPVEVPTAAVFGASELTRDCPPITIPDFLSGRGSNVCEPVVRRRFPEVGEVLDWLGQFGEARMTGTGSCAFVAFEGREPAEAALARMPADWQGFVARGVNRSPLLAALDRERAVEQSLTP